MAELQKNNSVFTVQFWEDFINKELGTITMNGALSDAFKIYFSIEAQSVFDDDEQYRSWKLKYEKIQSLERNHAIQLIPNASSLTYEHGAVRKSLERAVRYYCCHKVALSNLPWANFSNKSYKFERRCQKLREYLQNSYEVYEAWRKRISAPSPLSKAIVEKSNERELIIQLRKIASALSESDDSIRGLFPHEAHFHNWLCTDDLSACLIRVNETPIQEWLLDRLHHFFEEVRNSKILPLNTDNFRRGFEQQLLSSVASHLELPQMSYYAEDFILGAIGQKIDTVSITFIFYGLDQLSVVQKNAVWDFWCKVINTIKSKPTIPKKTEKKPKIIGLMPHGISKNCLDDKLYINPHPPLELIDSKFVKSWMLDESGNDVTQVKSLFTNSDFSYEEDIKESLLSAYESVDPLIKNINQYVTGCRNLENLRPYWSLAQ